MITQTRTEQNDHRDSSSTGELSKDPFSVLKFVRLAFRLHAYEAGQLPEHAGPMLRGAFGAALHAVACPFPDAEQNCELCNFSSTCAYLYLFETPRPPDAQCLRAADRIPHPFVLRPWTKSSGHVARGDELELELVLVGKAISRLPHVMVAMGRMASFGLGSKRLPLELKGVDQLHQGQIGERRPLFNEQRQVGEPMLETIRSYQGMVNNGLQIELLSPTHIVTSGRPLKHLEFQPLVRALLRRMSSLAVFHCDEPLDLDYTKLINHTGTIKLVEQQMRFVRFSRYSARQGQKVPQGGLLGKAILSGEQLREFIPLLALGELLHVGKGTSHGMGQYQMTGLDETITNAEVVGISTNNI